MATLDLVINSLSEDNFWVPKYHWGSWNKILKIHNKNINEFDDFNIGNFKAYDSLLGTSGVVMLCYPSNPTGWSPYFEDLKKFLEHSKEKNITVILDLPYYYLFNDLDNPIHELFYDNVIVISSFSKSMGLSGLRIGYIATKNQELYNSMKIRSLYKYNSISTIPQQIINKLLTTNNGKVALENYKRKTQDSIKRNIQYLKDRGFLFDEYPSTPTGPFAIVNINFDILLFNRISSVPLHKFSLNRTVNTQYSRISVAVPHELFKQYFDKIF
jgi:aspartate/methionine/tyrosine aminotransferase